MSNNHITSRIYPTLVEETFDFGCQKSSTYLQQEMSNKICAHIYIYAYTYTCHVVRIPNSC